jgi:hypothetical protein
MVFPQYRRTKEIVVSRSRRIAFSRVACVSAISWLVETALQIPDAEAASQFRSVPTAPGSKRRWSAESSPCYSPSLTALPAKRSGKAQRG